MGSKVETEGGSGWYAAPMQTPAVEGSRTRRKKKPPKGDVWIVAKDGKKVKTRTTKKVTAAQTARAATRNAKLMAGNRVGTRKPKAPKPVANQGAWGPGVTPQMRKQIKQTTQVKPAKPKPKPKK